MHSGKKWRSVLWLNEMHSGKKWWIRGFAPPSIIFILYPDYVSARSLRSNRPHSIYQYSNMALRLWGQNCKFSKFVLSLNSQKRLGYKENNTKYRSLSWKPRSHVRILIYRTWPINGRVKMHTFQLLVNRIYNKFGIKSFFWAKTSVALLIRFENCRKHCEGSQ